MSLASHPADRTLPHDGPMRGLLRRWAQCLRWALVLLLVGDIVSAPLHRHHHDSGIDGSAIHERLIDGPHAARHVDEHGPDADVVHRVTAMRAEPRAAARDAGADAPSRDAALTCPGVLPEPQAASVAGLSWSELDTPLHRLHRSLPPAGRAPPLRA